MPIDFNSKQRNAELASYLADHLAFSLMFLYGRAQNDGEFVGPPKPYLASACFCDLPGGTFILTAGHVRKDITRILNAPSHAIAAAHIVGLQPEQSHYAQSPAVPYEWHQQFVYSRSFDPQLQNPMENLDYGIIHASPGCLDSVQYTNRCRRNDVDIREYQAEDQFVCVGYPLEYIDEGNVHDFVVRKSRTWRPHPFVMPLTLKNATATSYSMKICDGASAETIQAIGGMSGGPVYKVDRHSGGGIRLRLAGLQSTWDKANRSTTVTRISAILDAELSRQSERE